MSYELRVSPLTAHNWHMTARRVQIDCPYVAQGFRLR